jgi:hypothetical protein
MSDDIDPIKRQRADNNNTLRPRWRLLLIVAASGIGMLLWLVLVYIR